MISISVKYYIWQGGQGIGVRGLRGQGAVIDRAGKGGPRGAVVKEEGSGVKNGEKRGEGSGSDGRGDGEQGLETPCPPPPKD